MPRRLEAPSRERCPRLAWAEPWVDGSRVLAAAACRPRAPATRVGLQHRGCHAARPRIRTSCLSAMVYHPLTDGGYVLNSQDTHFRTHVHDAATAKWLAWCIPVIKRNLGRLFHDPPVPKACEWAWRHCRVVGQIGVVENASTLWGRESSSFQTTPVQRQHCRAQPREILHPSRTVHTPRRSQGACAQLARNAAAWRIRHVNSPAELIALVCKSFARCAP